MKSQSSIRDSVLQWTSEGKRFRIPRNIDIIQMESELCIKCLSKGHCYLLVSNV